MDLQDFFTGQVVTADEMDQIYTDADAGIENLAAEAGIGQSVAASAARYGGILEGLVVTKISDQDVQVTAGSARDNDGQRIVLGVDANVLLTNLGDTTQGTTTNALGDGSVTADSITAGEAWVSLFIVFDTALSDTRIDALGNTINYRQTESFHFRIEVGTDAPIGTATDRPSLTADKILLADILLDNSGNIRVVNALDAICTSSGELNEINYGLHDTPNMAGRRSDWVAIDADGTYFEIWKDAYDTSKENNAAYLNIRAGNAREAIWQLCQMYNNEGSANQHGGSELIKGRPITGKSLSAPGSATALDMPSGSVHTQLEALYDKVNTLLSRGSDTLTGSLVVTAEVDVGTNLSVGGVTEVAALEISGNITLSGGTCIIGGEDLNILQSLDVDTNLNVDGTLDVGGESTFGGDATFNGDEVRINPARDKNALYLTDYNFGGQINPYDDHYAALGDHTVFQPFGRIARPVRFYDDFTYEWNEWNNHEGLHHYIVTADGTGGSGVDNGTSAPLGGWLYLSTDTTLSDRVDVRGAYLFELHQALDAFGHVMYPRFWARIGYKSTDVIANQGMDIGLADASGQHIKFVKTPSNSQLVFEIYGGTFTKSIATGVTPATGKAYDLFFAVIDATTVKYWVGVEGGGMSETADMTIGGASEPPAFTDAAWGSYSAHLDAKSECVVGGSSSRLRIDYWEAQGHLATGVYG